MTRLRLLNNEKVKKVLSYEDVKEFDARLKSSPVQKYSGKLVYMTLSIVFKEAEPLFL